MVRLINFKESLLYFYQKRESIVRPLFKGVFSFAVLFLLQNLFNYTQPANLLWILLAISVAQMLLPSYAMFFSASALIIYNLWHVSADLALGFFLLVLIALFTYVRIDARTACITMVVPILFYLQLEYLIPVILGISIGFIGIFPAVVGTLIYFVGLYTGDASKLLTYSSDSNMGVGLSRVVNLMVIDRRMLILLITFCLVIFITTLLYHMFYELAWLFSVTFGNAAMVFLLLCGRYIFVLDFAIWKLFLEAVISVGICVIYQFFKGIGDVSRMEKTSFEDEDYIYYVKAVPKIRVAQKNRNITNISSDRSQIEDDYDDEDYYAQELESQNDYKGEILRNRRADRKRPLMRKNVVKQPVNDKPDDRKVQPSDNKGQEKIRDEINQASAEKAPEKGKSGPDQTPAEKGPEKGKSGPNQTSAEKGSEKGKSGPDQMPVEKGPEKGKSGPDQMPAEKGPEKGKSDPDQMPAEKAPEKAGSGPGQAAVEKEPDQTGKEKT